MGTRQRKNEICFVACTHGDEPVGKDALDSIDTDTKFSKTFDWVIGNPKAFAAKKRFTEADLNRSAPGKPRSRTYEVRRAYELARLFETYRYVVDLHQTVANDRIILILTEISPRILALACAFPVKDILYWPTSRPGSTTGPLTRYVPRGLEVESGTKTSYEKTQKRLASVLKGFLREMPAIRKHEVAFSSRLVLPRDRRWFHVYGKIDPEEVVGKTLRDFRPVRGKTETFIPLFFGQYAGLIGYKMRLVDPRWIATQAKKQS